MNETESKRPNGTGMRVRWAAIGAAVAVTVGAFGTSGSIPIVGADTQSGERAVYTAIDPCRLLDTRLNTQVGPRGASLAGGETATFGARGAQGDCSASDLPADATALAFNVTAVGATELTFLTFWPDGERPGASSLNPAPGQPPAPNAVTTRLSESGSFQVFNNAGTVNLIIDVVGFYTDHGHDDRYYTKSEAHDRFVEGDPDVLRPHFVNGVSQIGYVYNEGAWVRPSDNTTACIVFPVDVPGGRTIERVDVRYLSSSSVVARALFASVTDSTEPIVNDVDLIDAAFGTTETVPPAVDNAIRTHSFTDDPTYLPTAIRTTTVDNGTASLSFCTESGQFVIAGIEIHLAPE